MKGGAEAGRNALTPDIRDFIVCLNRHKVDYVLVGAYALAVHGVIRATGDIDFLYRPAAANVRRLCAALDEFGAPPNVIDEAALLQRDTVTQIGRPPYRIDLLSAIDGVTFAKVWSGALHTRIDGQKLRVIGRAELEKNKRATGRTKDLEDIRRLTSDLIPLKPSRS